MEETQEEITITKLPLRNNPTGEWMLLCAAGLLGIGVVMVCSAMASLKGQPAGVEWYQRVDGKQVIYAVMSFSILFFGWRFNYRLLMAGKKFPVFATVLLVVALVASMLVFTPIGHAVGGKHRWVRITSNIQFQPSELLKFASIIFIAAVLTRPGARPKNFFVVAFCGIVTLVCMAAIITQDFGTGVLIGVSCAIAMFLAGVPWYYFAVAIPAAAYGGYKLMFSASYRVDRWNAFLNPWDNANPATYHPQQSLFAILGGGYTGVGLGNGIRKMDFLPEDTTDFIFAVFSEECGLFGAILLMGLLLVLLVMAYKTAARAGDKFGQVLAASLGSLIVLQATLHIAVNLALLPPTGIALPFISAGGTGLLIMAMAVSLIVSVSARPKDEILQNYVIKA